MTNRTHSDTLLIGALSARPTGQDTVAGNEVSSGFGIDIAQLINERIAPPIPLTKDDVHVRTLRLISDEVNDHGGRFPRDEHDRLCEILIDSPVLIGHDRTGLPVARNFAAQCVTESRRQWIEVSMFWLRSPFGDRLASDIDAGVVKEGSIGFEFRRPQCSVCGSDIRRCEHVPLQTYRDDDGGERVAHYEYRDIVRVLETSLVYRGATPGTRFVPREAFCKTSEDTHWSESADSNSVTLQAVVLSCLPGMNGSHQYLIARRDTVDPTMCEEATIASRGIFRIGERLALEDGVWRRLDPAIEAPGRPNNRQDDMNSTPSLLVGPDQRLPCDGEPSFRRGRRLVDRFGSGRPSSHGRVSISGRAVEDERDVVY